MVGLLDEAGEDPVRGRTDERGHAADRSAVCNRKQDADAEIMFVLADHFAFLRGANNAHDGHRNRNHHRGRRGIRHPG